MEGRGKDAPNSPKAKMYVSLLRNMGHIVKNEDGSQSLCSASVGLYLIVCVQRLGELLKPIRPRS